MTTFPNIRRERYRALEHQLRKALRNHRPTLARQLVALIVGMTGQAIALHDYRHALRVLHQAAQS